MAAPAGGSTLPSHLEDVRGVSRDSGRTNPACASPAVFVELHLEAVCLPQAFPCP